MRTASLRNETFNRIISIQASECPNEAFIVDRPTGQTISYREFNALTSRTARLLLDLDVGKGDRICLMLGNSVEFLAIYFGALRLGAVIVPVNPAFKGNEVRNILLHSEAKAVVADAEKVESLADLKPTLSSLTHLISCGGSSIPSAIDYDASLPQQSDSLDIPGASRDDVATILYTSGTTGAPKGVVLTHRNLVVNAYDISEALDLGRDCMMCILPLHHTNGQIINVMAPLISGGSVVLCEAFDVFTLSRFWDTISKYEVNVVDAVPTVLAMLLRFKTKRMPKLDSLRFIICGAAPLSVELQKQFEERFGCAIVQEYGLTEGTCVSSINSSSEKIGSIGLPLACNQMRIVDDQDAELPMGEVGEIVLRGENVMLEYYKNPAATSDIVRDGWLHTGDMGRMDSDGYFYILGRRKHIIIKGGENIYPIDIENAFCEHPKVSESAAIGISDCIYGENIKVYVVLEEGESATSEELVQFCRGRLPRLWCPREVEIVDVIPRTPSGKIIRRELGPCAQ